jgi:hypothetical protein
MSLTQTRKSLRQWPAWVILCLALLAPLVPLNAAPAQGVNRTQGAQAAAATFNANPNVIAGTDSTGVIRTLRVDSDGAITTAPGATSTEIEGEEASGTVSTTINPVLTGIHRTSNSSINRWTGDIPADALTNSGVYGYVQSLGSIFNGTTWDRLRSATAADASNTGVLACGMMARGSGALQTMLQAGPGDGDTGGRSLGTITQLFNGTTFDRPRSTSLGVTATGNFLVELSDSSAVQAAAYIANDLVGGKRTFASAVRLSGGSGLIKGVTIVDQAANSAANSVYDVIIFNSDPTGTTFTENSPLDVADADMTKIVAVIRLDGVAGATLFTNVDNNVLFKAVEVPYVASGTTSLFAALIARGGPTFAATTDVVVKLQMEQN